jgi:hypothetical protein
LRRGANRPTISIYEALDTIAIRLLAQLTRFATQIEGGVDIREIADAVPRCGKHCEL